MTTTNFKFAQLQPYALYGAGAVAGDTSIILKSMLDIDGNTLTMSADFGALGFGTLEPGNGVNEEQISFTGLTNNSNGTVTLSGVSNVGFQYPYTVTSGLLKNHAGSTTFIISNTSGFYDQLVAKNEDGTITATHTYTTPNYPQVDNSATLPTQQAQLATKAYVDSVVTGGAANATTSVQGLVQLATQVQTDAGTATGSTGASITPTPALLRSKLLSDYVADTGAADAYVITPAPAIAAYATGQIFSFKAAHTNTTTSTVNVNGKGTKTVKKVDGATNLAAADIVAGQIIIVEYDGTNFQMLNMPATNVFPSPTGNTNKFLTTTNGTSVSYGTVYDYQEFTSSGTWTKPTNLTTTANVKVQMWGNGGGGGGATNSGGANGAGGGGGAYVEAIFKASDLGSTVTVTIPAAAAGGIGNNAGASPANVTFGSQLTANSGAGGGTNTGGGNAVGGAGGAAPTGYSGFAGGTGGAGANSGNGSVGTSTASSAPGGGGGGGGTNVGGAGGSCSIYAIGVGGAGNASGNSNGADATGIGSGGGGAGSNGNSESGGAGTKGLVRVWTFF